MAVEDCKMATQTKLANKVADINRLINHNFTSEELTEKLRRQGAFDYKKNILRRFEIERQVKFAKANGDTEGAEELQNELDHLLNPNLSWGTTINANKPAAEKTLSEAERVHQINLRNQKLNYENVRRAQLEERKAARKAAAAVARGEAAADPFMRVRTIAKTHHDVSGKSSEMPKTVEATPSGTPKDSPKPATGTPSRVATPASQEKPKGAFMIRHSNNDDENIAALDLDLDIEI